MVASAARLPDSEAFKSLLHLLEWTVSAKEAKIADAA